MGSVLCFYGAFLLSHFLADSQYNPDHILKEIFQENYILQCHISFYHEQSPRRFHSNIGVIDKKEAVLYHKSSSGQKGGCFFI